MNPDTANKKDFDLYLKELESAYYNNEALVDDSIYDNLVSIYNTRFGDRYEEGIIGAPVENDYRVKVKLPYELWSLNKITIGYTAEKNVKATKMLDDFMSSAKDFVLEDKLDGMTGLYHQGKLYSLGNGKIGNDISYLLPSLDLPNIDNITVRGEIVVERKHYKTFKSKDLKNLRNITVGLVNSKVKDDWEYLSFYAYQIVNTNIKASEQIEQLIEYGFKVPESVAVDEDSDITLESLQEYYIDRNKNAKYDMDGIVMIADIVMDWPSDKNPSHAFAFKIPGQLHETTVIKVVYNPSKNGYLKPTVYYEPVSITNAFDNVSAVLSAASGHNAKYIYDNFIGPGSKIIITRNMDCNPYIVMVKEPAKVISKPLFEEDEYKWIGPDLVLLKPTQEVYAERLNYFITCIDIKLLGPKRTLELVALGINTIDKMIRFKDWNKIPRLGDKTSTKIVEELERKLTNVDKGTIMAASGLFGRGFSIKRAHVLLESCPDILQSNDIYNDVIGIRGFGEIMTEKIVIGIPLFNEWIKKQPIVIAKVHTHVQGPLSGKIIVPTGFVADESFTQQVESRGGTIGNNITKRDSSNTIVVIVGNRLSGKIKKASEMGIRIMGKADFDEEYL